MMDGFGAFRRSPDDKAVPRPEDDAEGDRVGLMVLPFRAPLLPLLMKRIGLMVLPLRAPLLPLLMK